MKEGGGESRKSRSSVMDQLNALEGGGSSVTTTKRTEYVEEYVWFWKKNWNYFFNFLSMFFI